MIPGAPPPGTLQKRPRPATEWQRRLEWARQPTGGWKEGDFCMTPAGRLGRVVAVREDSLALQYVQASKASGLDTEPARPVLQHARARRDAEDVRLKRHLCRWLSPREVQSLKRPNNESRTEGGGDAAA